MTFGALYVTLGALWVTFGALCVTFGGTFGDLWGTLCDLGGHFGYRRSVAVDWFYWWNDELGWLRLHRCPVSRIVLAGCWGGVDVDYSFDVPLTER